MSRRTASQHTERESQNTEHEKKPMTTKMNLLLAEQHRNRPNSHRKLRPPWA